jgi:hypothetical protein
LVLRDIGEVRQRDRNHREHRDAQRFTEKSREEGVASNISASREESRVSNTEEDGEEGMV